MTSEDKSTIEGVSIDNLLVPVDIEQLTSSAKIVETPQSIHVVPVSAPIRFIGICLLIPELVGIWLFTVGPLNPDQDRIGAIEWRLALSMFVLTSVGMIAFFYFVVRINRKDLEKGPFLVIHKNEGRFSFPRHASTFNASCIKAVIELRVSIEGHNSKSRYSHVSVLANQSNEIVRVPVLADNLVGFRVSKAIVQLIQDYSNAPLHRLKRPKSDPHAIDP